MQKLSELEGFEWDAGNTHKPGKHDVLLKEAEEVFFDPKARVQFDEPHSKQEKRWWLWGRTVRSRKLKIAFTVRGKKVRVISARDMNKKERQFYETH